MRDSTPPSDRVNETSPIRLDRATEIDCGGTVDLNELIRVWQDTSDSFVGSRVEGLIEQLVALSYNRGGARALRKDRPQLITAWRRLADLIHSIPVR